MNEYALYTASPVTQGPQMTGRLYKSLLPSFEWTFWHSVSATEQGLYSENAPHGGIDAAVVDYLMGTLGYGSLLVHHSGDPVNGHYLVAFQHFLEHAVYRLVGGRARLFLPAEHWIAIYWTVPERRLERLVLDSIYHDPRDVPPNWLTR